MKSKELYEECVKAWGVNSQMNMAVEEASEFIQAISKFNRGDGIAKLLEEIADIELMIAQVKYMISTLPGSTEDRIKKAIKNWRVLKIERLKKRLEWKRRSKCDGMFG